LLDDYTVHLKRDYQGEAGKVGRENVLAARGVTALAQASAMLRWVSMIRQYGFFHKKTRYRKKNVLIPAGSTLT